MKDFRGRVEFTVIVISFGLPYPWKSHSPKKDLNTSENILKGVLLVEFLFFYVQLCYNCLYCNWLFKIINLVVLYTKESMTMTKKIGWSF